MIRDNKKSSKLQQKWPRIEKAILTVWFPLLPRYVHYRQVWTRVSSSFEFQVKLNLKVKLWQHLDFFSWLKILNNVIENCKSLVSQVIFQSRNGTEFFWKLFVSIYTKLVQQIVYETLHLVKLRSILNFGMKFKMKIQVVLWSETERWNSNLHCYLIDK